MEKRRVKGGGGEGGVVLSMVHWGRGSNRGNRVGGVYCGCVCVCGGGLELQYTLHYTKTMKS